MHDTHSFLPFLFFWTRSEAAVSYQAILCQLVCILHHVHGISIEDILKRIKISLSDRSLSIRNALSLIIPGICKGNCYAHFMRKVNEKVYLICMIHTYTLYVYIHKKNSKYLIIIISFVSSGKYAR